MDATLFNEQLLAILRAIPGLGGQVFDGDVPTKLPTDGAGYIRPYVVVFSGLSADLPGERDLTGLADTSVHDWSPQTTCVGPTPAHARAVAVAVKSALTNARIGNHWLLPDPDGFRVNVPIRDNQVTPARFFLPLPWRLTTN